MSQQIQVEHFKIAVGFKRRLLHESFIAAGQLNPNYPLLLTLESDVPTAEIKNITYRRYLSDVYKVSTVLQDSIPKRKVGTEPRYVGILGRSTYSYAVHQVACLINHWIVSILVSDLFHL